MRSCTQSCTEISALGRPTRSATNPPRGVTSPYVAIRFRTRRSPRSGGTQLSCACLVDRLGWGSRVGRGAAALLRVRQIRTIEIRSAGISIAASGRRPVWLVAPERGIGPVVVVSVVAPYGGNSQPPGISPTQAVGLPSSPQKRQRTQAAPGPQNGRQSASCWQAKHPPPAVQ
jgi:hypothetical protein